jgi:hypothetical protein
LDPLRYEGAIVFEERLDGLTTEDEG